MTPAILRRARLRSHRFAMDTARLFRYHAPHKADVQNPGARSELSRRMYKILGGDQKEYGPVTSDQVREWIAQRRAGAETMVRAEGATEWQPLGTIPEFAPALLAPLPAGVAPTATVVTPDNPLSMVVPYKNPKALIAYYLAIFSLIPCLGLPLGIAAFVLGLLGRKAAQAHPHHHGTVHAWIGIVLGGLCGLGNLVILILMILGAFAGKY